MRRKFTGRAGPRSVVATLAVAFGFMVLPVASATASPDPQTTNVPYLGWAGEQIRMVKCFDLAPLSDMTQLPGLLSQDRAEFLVEDWSGDPNFKPQIEDPTVKLFWSSDREQVCAQGDAISLDPGMARIELDVTDNAGILGLPGRDPANPVLKHQFLTGWMTLNDPSLTELGAANFASTAQANAAATLGDPAGDGHFTAGSKYGLLSVTVTGSMPMNGTWAALVGKSSVTLPGDWATLANALATDSNPADANPAMRWDIHDDDLATEGHTPGIRVSDHVGNQHRCRRQLHRWRCHRAVLDHLGPVEQQLDRSVRPAAAERHAAQRRQARRG